MRKRTFSILLIFILVLNNVINTLLFLSLPQEARKRKKIIVKGNKSKGSQSPFRKVLKLLNIFNFALISSNFYKVYSKESIFFIYKTNSFYKSIFLLKLAHPPP